MQTEILGIRSDGSGSEVAVKASRDGDMRVAQYLPPYAMLCAAGKIFSFDTSAGTAKPPDNAPVTTTAMWGIYNANDTKHLVLIHVGVALKGGIAGLGLCIMAASAKGPQTVINTNYSTGSAAIISCLDGTTKTPQAYIQNNITLVGGTPSWLVLKAIDQVSSNGVGNGMVVRSDGYIVAPPQGIIAVDIVGELGSSALWWINIVVAEVEMD